MYKRQLRNLDSTVEEAARSLGVKRFRIYTSVVIPRLKKPIIYSGLLVGLYVISDFGAVSLMRYSTVTKAIYTYYEFSLLGDPIIFYSGLLIFLALIISFIQRGSDVSRSAKVSGTPREYPFILRTNIKRIANKLNERNCDNEDLNKTKNFIEQHFYFIKIDLDNLQIKDNRFDLIYSNFFSIKNYLNKINE